MEFLQPNRRKMNQRQIADCTIITINRRLQIREALAVTNLHIKPLIHCSKLYLIDLTQLAALFFTMPFFNGL